MARVIRFEKWEGLGNDFVLVHSGDPEVVDRLSGLAPSLCDRRHGVGADGVLLVTGVADGAPRMVVLNADGSRPEMCGNGLRCVAAHLVIKAGTVDPASLTIATDAGDRRCEVHAGAGAARSVTVGMGTARLGPPLELAWRGEPRRFTTVDVGNPHAISFDPFDDALVDGLGPLAATSPPGGTNVEFCRVLAPRDGRSIVEVVVWERGVGRTQACGTGACAVAAVACEEGHASYGAPIGVRLPGGELEIVVTAGERSLTMTGPARRVFAGEVALS